MMRDVPATDRRDAARARRDRRSTRRATACGSCSARRSSDRRCCWISSRRSFRRRRRCCRFSRRTSCTSARGATAGSYAGAGGRRGHRERGDGAARASHRRRGPTLLWAVVGYGAGDGRVRRLAIVLADVRLPRLAGATDAVSMVIRNLVRQLETPDATARPDDRRQHGVLHGRPAARRARGRPASRTGSARRFRSSPAARLPRRDRRPSPPPRRSCGTTRATRQ